VWFPYEGPPDPRSPGPKTQGLATLPPKVPFDFYSVPSHASEILVHPSGKVRPGYDLEQ
jgi:hypothetical protein